MKKMNLLMRKCKNISKQLGRSNSSCSSLRSQSARDETSIRGDEQNPRSCETVVYVGRTRKRYVISKRYLKHPLLKALIEKQQKQKPKNTNGDEDEDDDNNNNGGEDDGNGNRVILVKCEVVLFDHLLWMLENGDQNHILESLDELADLYISL